MRFIVVYWCPDGLDYETFGNPNDAEDWAEDLDKPYVIFEHTDIQLWIARLSILGDEELEKLNKTLGEFNDEREM